MDGLDLRIEGSNRNRILVGTTPKTPIVSAIFVIAVQGGAVRISTNVLSVFLTAFY
jgi:hypothetical protein